MKTYEILNINNPKELISVSRHKEVGKHIVVRWEDIVNIAEKHCSQDERNGFLKMLVKKAFDAGIV